MLRIPASLKEVAIIIATQFFFFKFYFVLEYSLILNVVLVSDVQQSDSVIHVSLLFQILSPIRLLQNIDQSSQCYTVVPCLFSSVQFSRSVLSDSL